MPTKLTEEDILSTIHLSSREAAAVLGVGKSTINDARKRYEQQHLPNKTEVVASGDSMEEVLQTLRDGKTDVSNHTLSFTTVERELADGSVRHQYTIRAAAKKQKDEPQIPDADEIVAALDNWTYEPQELNPVSAPIFVVCPADLQVGKVSDKGGTDELEARVKASFDRAADKAKAAGGYPVIVMADLGDIIENFYNVASQRETNDRDLTTQVRIARKLMAYGINVLAPYCQRMYVVSVPSNHASVRVSFKSDAAHPSNDWGVEINHQLSDVFSDREEFNHVNFVTPDGLNDTVGLALQIGDDRTTFGFVHGHQAVKAEKLGDWWRGQALGRGPVSTADILLAGHFHSFRMSQAGDERWVIVAPSSDNGSDWYRRITGDVATAGMLTFEATNGSWQNLEIV